MTQRHPNRAAISQLKALAHTVSVNALTVRTALVAAGRSDGLRAQVAMMVANDVTWIGFWVIFSSVAGDLRGWDTTRLLVLEAVLLTAGGTALGFLANTRRLHEVVSRGSLDSILALPTAPLPQVVFRRVEPIFLVDITVGIGLFLVAARPSIIEAGLFVMVTALGIVVIASIMLLLNSIAFIGLPARVAESATQMVILFSAYPIDLYGATVRFVLYVVVPVGFVTAVPSALLTTFTWRWMGALVAVAVGLAWLAAFAFNRGLRRYTSDSLWADRVG